MKRKNKGHGGKKASQTKLNNKKMSQLAKQGKLKKKKKSSEDTTEATEVKDTLYFKKVVETPDHSMEEDLSEEDLDFFSTPGKDASFISTAHTRLVSEVGMIFVLLGSGVALITKNGH